MIVMQVLGMISGAVLLSGGIFVMRYGLTTLFAGKAERVLALLSEKPWQGFLVGMLAAALLQGSTGVSLITIGLVGSRCLAFPQGVSIILGANVGTCSTVQILSFTPNVWILAALAAFCLLAAILSKRTAPAAVALAGVCSMFLGIQVLTASLAPLIASGSVDNYLDQANACPAYGILAGMALTTAMQSSSAATGVLIALAQQGAVSMETAAFVVYGNNIGSCLSSLVVAAAAPIAARRVAVAHILLNVAGAALFMPFTHSMTAMAIWLADATAGQVAMIHTLFNVISSVLVLPVIRPFCRLVSVLTPGRGN